MFSIEFTDEPLDYPYDDRGIPAAPGLLVMGETKEGLLANLALWSKKDYELHWRGELRSIVEGGSKAALITSYHDPLYSSNIEIWPVYRDGELVRIQNHLPWYDSFPPDFKVSELNIYMGDREEIDDEGHRLSEWSVTIQDIREFLERSGGPS